jgi:hypothetical protein
MEEADTGGAQAAGLADAGKYGHQAQQDLLGYQEHETNQI